MSDVHANREAYDAAMAAIARERCDRLIFLGDIVGYGPDPAYVADSVRRETGRGAIALLGNHDEAVAGPGEPADMNAMARAGVLHNRRALDAETRAWLGALPLAAREGPRLFVHASAETPERWNYLLDRTAARGCFAATDAREIFCGHTHRPMLFHAAPGQPVQAFRPIEGRPIPLSRRRRHILVCGAVGQPRDGNPCAAFAVLDTEAGEATALRAPYDLDTTMRKIRAAGLPEWLGLRLAEGC